MRVTIEQIRDEISDRLEMVGVWITSRTKRRARWIGSTVIVVGLHAALFWVLVVSKTENMHLKEYREVIYPLEVYEMEKPEEIPEVEPVPKPEPQDVAERDVEVTPPEVPPEPQPQPQPSPVESPRRSLTVKPFDMPDLSPKTQPSARNETRSEVSTDDSQTPEVPLVRTPGVKKRNDDERITARPVENARAGANRDVSNDNQAVASVRTPGAKKRKDDEQIAARPGESARASSNRDVSNMNLHVPDQVTADAPTSGLTAARKPAGSAGGGGGGGGMSGAGLPPGALQGLSGGRSGVSQAIQNHNSCVELQQTGKPIPESCNMPALASQGRMGPKPDRDFQNTANQRDANLRYKTTPGSTDYWKRVNASPSPGSGGRDDDLPKKGVYSSDKDARVMNGDNIDPKNGN
ncbi:hypothetical protein ABAC460_05165 [Asticcacaulis sp. AC460]|uniref:hypothetical protein n=1 Tax=Asticcacaulis sp. AC460 TaxID=1282360 RepID=UPI0003C40A15|nr:hypothetical protein [Asticcacaulis sp. AC460]ESQ91731.1 hypothetical protein ABAC460_05165 [Asticcacaulis sp. AC460]